MEINPSITAIHEASGLNGEMPDWLREELAEEDPIFYSGLAEAAPLLFGFNLKNPFELCGMEVNHAGFRITNSLARIG